jgi:adenosylcobinamide-GDP ribazoletransferase
LTRLPLGRRLQVDQGDLARAGVAFPPVGAAIGTLVGGVVWLLAHPIGALPAATVGLAGAALLTGGLHLDALADSADALAGRTRERALAIMRDHAIGAYGTVAIVLDLLLKAGALAALAPHLTVLRAAVAAGALSRAAPVVLAATLPYARSDAGLGTPLTQGSRRRATLAALLAGAIAVAVAGAHAAIAAGIVAALLIALHASYRRWLGGVTGDLLGAAVELSEIAVLLTMVALTGTR